MIALAIFVLSMLPDRFRFRPPIIYYLFPVLVGDPGRHEIHAGSRLLRLFLSLKPADYMCITKYKTSIHNYMYSRLQNNINIKKI